MLGCERKTLEAEAGKVFSTKVNIDLSKIHKYILNRKVQER